MRKYIAGMTAVAMAGIFGFNLGMRKSLKKLNSSKITAEKNRSQFILMNQWLKLKREGRSIVNYFEEKNYKKIAVYGMSYIGENVLAELKDSGIEVAYCIDQRAGEIFCEVDVYSLQNELPQADAVVVSETFYFSEVEPVLREKMQCPVVSLEEVIYES